MNSDLPSLDLPKIREPESFRDRIPTADQRGNRKWVYARKPPCGKRRGAGTFDFYRARTLFAWILLVLMFAGPFIRINGNPLLLFNIPKREFCLFGSRFFPQEFYLFALIMILGMVMIVLFTAVFGRVWCGWACPQTVLMEMVFRKIEYFIEGDRREQQQRNARPWDLEKALKKGTKHAVFLGLSFIIANWLLMYVIGNEAWWILVSDDPRNHLRGLTAMVLFTGVFYAIFARFREQACTFICPYGRFQSVMLDENTMVVAYDYKRGEPRRRLRALPVPDPLTLEAPAPQGDCIDCSLCVEVCPTGIDIRHGTQMECVNCTACIDACNSVMTKIGKAPGLIRFASLNNIEEGKRFHVTPRLKAYMAILVLLSSLLAVLLTGRADLEATLFRAAGTSFQEQADGRVSNVFRATIVNKTNRTRTLAIRLRDIKGEARLGGGQVEVVPADTTKSVLMVVLDRSVLTGRNTPIALELLEDGVVVETLETQFAGPSPRKGK